MRIHEVGLSNFKAFRGEHVVKFNNLKRGKNVYLIGALNGAGKTTLVQALQLALYGAAAAGLPAMFAGGRDHRRRYELWLSACLNKAAALAHDQQMHVRLVATLGDSQIVVTRRYWFGADGSFAEETLTAIVDGGELSGTYQDEDAQDVVVDLIPRHLADLTFFDGERIRELDAGASSGWLVAAVDQLLNLAGVTKVSQDLERLSRDRRMLLADQGQLDARHRLGEQQASLEAAITAEDAARAVAQERLDALHADRRRIDDELSGALVDGQPLTSAQVETEIAALMKRRDELRGRLGRSIADWMYFDLAPDLLSRAVAAAESGRAERVFRDKVKLQEETAGQLVDLILHDADVKRLVTQAKSSRFAERLRALQQQFGQPDLASSIEHWCSTFTDRELDEVAAAGSALQARDRTDVEHIALDLVHVLDRLDELHGLRAMLESRTGLDALMRARRELEQAVGDASAEVGRAQQQVELLRGQLVTTRQALSHLDATLEDAEDAKHWLAAAEQIAAAARAYVDQRRRSALVEISEGVLSYLRRLLRKRGLVTAVDIDAAKHALVLRDKSGRRVELASAGEQQLAALAFAATMLDLAGDELPLFIDTPLARLDGPHRRRFAEAFCGSLNRQVFILSTDEEVDGELLELLRPHVIETYVIEHDEDEGSSTVTPGVYLDGTAA